MMLQRGWYWTKAPNGEWVPVKRDKPVPGEYECLAPSGDVPFDAEDFKDPEEARNAPPAALK